MAGRTTEAENELAKYRTQLAPVHTHDRRPALEGGMFGVNCEVLLNMARG